MTPVRRTYRLWGTLTRRERPSPSVSAPKETKCNIITIIIIIIIIINVSSHAEIHWKPKYPLKHIGIRLLYLPSAVRTFLLPP
jgi:hypothetical protein